MKSMYEAFGTDKDLETKGVTLDYSAQGFKVVIARAGGHNVRFSQAVTKHTKALKGIRGVTKLSVPDQERMLANVYADAVILGWYSKNEESQYEQGIYDASGGILPYNRNNVVETLLALPDLFRDIREQAEDLATFQKDATEEIAKN